MGVFIVVASTWADSLVHIHRIVSRSQTPTRLVAVVFLTGKRADEVDGVRIVDSFTALVIVGRTLPPLGPDTLEIAATALHGLAAIGMVVDKREAKVVGCGAGGFHRDQLTQVQHGGVAHMALDGRIARCARASGGARRGGSRSGLGGWGGR